MWEILLLKFYSIISILINIYAKAREQLILLIINTNINIVPSNRIHLIFIDYYIAYLKKKKL